MRTSLNLNDSNIILPPVSSSYWPLEMKASDNIQQALLIDWPSPIVVSLPFRNPPMDWRMEIHLDQTPAWLDPMPPSFYCEFLQRQRETFCVKQRVKIHNEGENARQDATTIATTLVDDKTHGTSQWYWLTWRARVIDEKHPGSQRSESLST